MSNASVPMKNYMVPSNGTTKGVYFKLTLNAKPYPIDWRQYSVDNAPFSPQGVFIDNTAGTGDATITILPLGWKVICPAGQQYATSFPAPAGQTCTITGTGDCVFVFVDFPVLPSSEQVTLAGTPTVDIAAISTTDTLFTIPSPTSQGLPYRCQEYVPTAEHGHIQLTGATTSANFTPATANQNLRKVTLTLSGDATLAASGEVTITLTLNGVIIFTAVAYLANAVPASSPSFEEFANLDFSMIGLNAAAGNLTASISAALASGTLDVNAYFSPQ